MLDLPPPTPVSDPELKKIAAMPPGRRAIALSSAVYEPNDTAAQLVGSVAAIPIWGESARRQFDRLLAAAEKVRAKEERAALGRGRKQTPRRVASQRKQTTSANLFLLLETDDETVAAEALPASQPAAFPETN